MSYILDALKKSDQERKRGDVPNLQTVHIPINAEPQTPFTLYGLIFLLLIALAFVIGLVVSGSESEVKQTVEKGNVIESHDNTKNAKRSVLSQHEGLTTSAVDKKTEQPVTTEVTQQSNEKSRIEDSVQIKSKTVEVGVSDEPVVQAVSEKDGMAENKVSFNDIPYLHEMPEYQQQSVPDMSFAGHVYSSRASSRSVIINGDAMSEGDVIVQGLNVVEITPSGVVFSLHNELFRMDILQDWSLD